MQIIPAILPEDFADLEDKLSMVKGISRTVQIDICDGVFVPSQTWPYKKQDDNFAEIIAEERGMPYWEDIDFEFDLMISKPGELIGEWLSAGASRIVLHLNSEPDLTETIQKLSGIVDIGIAIRSNTPIEAIEKYVDSINFIQCMGIQKVGFQGQEFDHAILEKIREIKAKYPNMIVSVDGSVNEETAPLLKDAGADRLVVGSALFNSDNIAEEYNFLANI